MTHHRTNLWESHQPWPESDDLFDTSDLLDC